MTRARIEHNINSHGGTTTNFIDGPDGILSRTLHFSDFTLHGRRRDGFLAIHGEDGNVTVYQRGKELKVVLPGETWSGYGFTVEHDG